MSTTEDRPGGDDRQRSAPGARDARYGLEEALDGELPVDLIEKMLRHAGDCPECAEELERLRRVKALVRRSCTDRAPSSLRERISVQYRSVTVSRTGPEGSSSVRITSTRSTSLPPQS